METANATTLHSLTSDNLADIQRLTGGQFSSAIEALLKKTTGNTRDLNELEESWKMPSSWPWLINPTELPTSSTLSANGDEWELASALASAKAPQFLEYVLDARVKSLVERDEWDRVLEISKNSGLEVLGKYSGKFRVDVFRVGHHSASYEFPTVWKIGT
eukprot:TRINITY_DN1810_c0_g1_i1.p1 TRINITY_DN1810_c0_g1~~TRINITY_DN1810_c0_g1_i1.p1  ORF type:complete len:160 (-),score=40.02 TRINITY_DN1810_c0_g1_i1:1609-2088(-)